jgi:hypothetical protein
MMWLWAPNYEMILTGLSAGWSIEAESVFLFYFILFFTDLFYFVWVCSASFKADCARDSTQRPNLWALLPNCYHLPTYTKLIQSCSKTTLSLRRTQVTQKLMISTSEDSKPSNDRLRWGKGNFSKTLEHWAEHHQLYLRIHYSTEF